MQVTGNRASEAQNRTFARAGFFSRLCLSLRGRNFGKMLKIKMQNIFMTCLVWAVSRPQNGCRQLGVHALLFLVPLSHEKAVLARTNRLRNLPRGNAQSSGFTPIELPSDLTVLWETKLDEAIETTPVVGHGKLFTADIFGKLGVRSRVRRAELEARLRNGIPSCPGPEWQKMVIGDVDGNVYALNPETGEELCARDRWRNMVLQLLKIWWSLHRRMESFTALL